MLFTETKNKTKKILLKKHKIANGVSQAIGLMFSRKKKFDYALIFDRDYESKINSSIHMFFVFYRITVIFLNSKKEVVDIKKNLKPFRLYIPKRKAKYVIEIPVDTNLLSLKLKDKIDWK